MDGIKEIKGKKIVVCRLHWFAFAIPCFLIYLICLIMLFFSKYTAVFIFAFCSIIAAIVIFLRYNHTFIVLTETEIIASRVFPKYEVITSPIYQVQNIRIGLRWGTGLDVDCHHITIDTAGTGGHDYEFKYMTNANKLKEEIMKRLTSPSSTNRGQSDSKSYYRAYR